MKMDDLMDDSQVSGWIVVEAIDGHNALSRAMGTRSGRLLKSEEAADRFARGLHRDNDGRHYVVLPVQRYDV